MRLPPLWSALRLGLLPLPFPFAQPINCTYHALIPKHSKCICRTDSETEALARVGEGNGVGEGQGESQIDRQHSACWAECREKREVRGLATVCLFHAALGNVGQMCVWHFRYVFGLGYVHHLMLQPLFPLFLLHLQFAVVANTVVVATTAAAAAVSVSAVAEPSINCFCFCILHEISQNSVHLLRLLL